MASSNLFGGGANVGQMLTQADLGQIIQSVGVGISKAQYAMDSSSIELLERLAAHTVTLSPTGNDGQPSGAPANTRTLLSLGFTPTFYQISEVNLEAKISMSTTSSEEFSSSASLRVGSPISIAAVTVDASYSNKYSFSAEASSMIKARFVALPPPMELRQAIEQMKPRPPFSPTVGQTAKVLEEVDFFTTNTGNTPATPAKVTQNTIVSVLELHSVRTRVSYTEGAATREGWLAKSKLGAAT